MRQVGALDVRAKAKLFASWISRDSCLSEARRAQLPPDRAAFAAEVRDVTTRHYLTTSNNCSRLLATTNHYWLLATTTTLYYSLLTTTRNY